MFSANWLSKFPILLLIQGRHFSKDTEVFAGEAQPVIFSLITRCSALTKASLSSPPGMGKIVSLNFSSTKFWRLFFIPTRFFDPTASIRASSANWNIWEDRSEDGKCLLWRMGSWYFIFSWFKGLYETVLGQSEGPRMGSFIKLYGIESTKKLLEKVLEGELVKE